MNKSRCIAKTYEALYNAGCETQYKIRYVSSSEYDEVMNIVTRIGNVCKMIYADVVDLYAEPVTGLDSMRLSKINTSRLAPPPYQLAGQR